MATRRLAQKVLKELLKSSDPIRDTLVAQVGQILFVSPKRFKEALADIFGDSLDAKALDAIWKEWDIYLQTQRSSRNITKQRLQELTDALHRIPPRRGEKAYIIASYETIKKAKGGSGKLGSIIKTKGIDENDNRLNLIGGKGDKFGSQLGHEEKGRGAAASAAKVLKAKGLVSRSKAKEKEQIFELIDDYLNDLDVTITHEQMFTAKGKLRKKYIPVLTWQKAVDNQTMKRTEEDALKFLQAELSENLAEMEGSTPLKDALSQIMFFNVSPKKQTRRVRTKGKKKAVINEKNKSSQKGKQKQKRKIKAVRDGGLPASLTKLKAKKSSQGFNQLSLLALINKKLPKTVQKNMRPPALQSQTGRLARSVELKDVTTTRQGFLSFGYTYEKDPYQVFEVGAGAAPWASPQRDPRRLIDRSVREVAAELALGRFYTRRL
tara:strand:- start:13787 stop:15094 length:1308 start_codon:yes stop_codon:yes gene_type:complete